MPVRPIGLKYFSLIANVAMAVAMTIPKLDILFKLYTAVVVNTKDDSATTVPFGRFYLPSLKRRKHQESLIP